MISYELAYHWIIWYIIYVISHMIHTLDPPPTRRLPLTYLIFPKFIIVPDLPHEKRTLPGAASPWRPPSPAPREGRKVHVLCLEKCAVWTQFVLDLLLLCFDLAQYSVI